MTGSSSVSTRGTFLVVCTWYKCTKLSKDISMHYELSVKYVSWKEMRGVSRDRKVCVH